MQQNLPEPDSSAGRATVPAFRRAAIVDWFYDAAVSGADPIEARPGFAALPARIAGNGVRTIIVETANRFVGKLMRSPR